MPSPVEWGGLGGVPGVHSPHRAVPMQVPLPPDATAAAAAAAAAASLPHVTTPPFRHAARGHEVHMLTPPVVRPYLDPRHEAALLAFTTLIEADEREKALGLCPTPALPPPQPTPKPRAPTIRDTATRYLVKKLALQESVKGVNLKKTVSNRRALGRVLAQWEDKLKMCRAVVRSFRGVKVGDTLVVEVVHDEDDEEDTEGDPTSGTALHPGAIIHAIEGVGFNDERIRIEDADDIAQCVANHGGACVRRGGEDKQAEGSSHGLQGPGSPNELDSDHDTEEGMRLQGGRGIVVFFTRPAFAKGSDVVFLQQIELRVRSSTSEDTSVANAVTAGGPDLSYESHYDTCFIPRFAFGTALEGRRHSTTPNQGGANDPPSDRPNIVKVSVKTVGRQLVFWVDKEFVSGIGPLKQFSTVKAVTVTGKEDVARLLVTAYAKTTEKAVTETLSKEEYDDLCKDTGLTPDFEAVKDKTTGGVTAKSIRKRADKLLQDNEEILREIAMSKNAQKQTLQTSDAVCAAKLAVPLPTLRSLKADIGAISSKLQKLYSMKPGGVLDELVANLKAPQGVDRLLVLSEASGQLLKAKGSHYPNKTRVDLILMLLYTMSGPDIDSLMGYGDVPDYNTQKEAWTKYNDGVGKERNKAVFSEVNGLMRGVADIEKCDWAAVARWVKTICHLHSLCVGSKKFDSSKTCLSRGITGLPENVVAAHNTLSNGDSLTWTAPSSCAVDPQIAIDYLMGNAANAQKKPSGEGSKEVAHDSILFTVEGKLPALPLSNISKYPKEAEMLVPPLSTLKVKRRVKGNPHGGCLNLVAEWTSAASLDTIASRLSEDSLHGAEMMEKRSAQKDSRVREFLAGQRSAPDKQPPWLPTSPRPGFLGVNPPAPVADHQSVNPIVCLNAFSSTSPRRARSPKPAGGGAARGSSRG